MNSVLIITVAAAAVVLIVLGKLTAPYRSQVVPNYRAMFGSGIVFIPMALATNYGLLAVGFIMMAIGWRNRDMWGQHTRWADYPPALKKLKLLFAGGLGTLAISLTIFLIVSGRI